MLDLPEDDLRRLVYADWLEERGDPHAEYLRVQSALRTAVRDRLLWDDFADRERRLRATLDPGWTARFRRLTTELPPFEVAALDPALSALAAPATLLHPRAGEVPEPGLSKLGGLFLWPDDEPWPVRREYNPSQDADTYSFDPLPPAGMDIPLAPVIQIRKADAGHLPFPPGTDLMQVFWCPLWDNEHGPEPFVVWRDSRRVQRPRTTPPALTYTQWGLVPISCRVYPELVTEYPHDEDRPPTPGLSAEEERWAATWPDPADAYTSWWTRSHGAKVGGYPWVNQTDCVRVERVTEDGRPMRLLLSLSGCEIDHCHWRWCPIEDRNLCFTGSQVREELTGGFHRFSRGNYHVLYDTADPRVVKAFYDYAG